MAWYDYFKIFNFTFKKEKEPNLSGSGVIQPDIIQSSMIGDEMPEGHSLVSYRDTREMIDTTTLTNRTSRYKEYERLRNLPEIETVMTVISDEACVSGKTKIATPFGFKTIEELVADNDPEEKFLVYSYDANIKDFSLGWAYHPRYVKTEKTITVILDNGSNFTVTTDHKILKRNGEWVEAGTLVDGDHLMAFYRLPVSHYLSSSNKNQFPRIFTYNRGWVNERIFVDEWRKGKLDNNLEKTLTGLHALSKGLTLNKAGKLIGMTGVALLHRIKTIGFTKTELEKLSKKEDYRRVVGIVKNKEEKVYDISVEKHKCFCTDSVVLHNCQKDNEGNICKITTNNNEIKEELEFLFFHRNMINLNKNGWCWFKNLCVNGDHFIELIIDQQDTMQGIYKAISLPVETMFRIETTKGRLVEFQQSKEGPDYEPLTNPVKNNNINLDKCKAIRFNPNQIVHFRVGEDRKQFYPYGVSLIEPARSPAHQLRLMEDAMVTYRLSRAPERRVFYVDVGQLPPFKVDSLIDRMKDQFRKRKIAGGSGGNVDQIDERWQPPAVDEDFWLPLRPGSNTRIETLPGAQNLGEVDDALYFRNKLFVSLNFPKSYFSGEDVNTTRITLSAQDVKFARMIERLQSSFEEGLYEIADRHLHLRGYPQEMYKDLKIKMTPPSDWRELSKAEVLNTRLGIASQLKSGALMSDFDIYVNYLGYDKETTRDMLSRLKIQKLEDLKIQIIGQNPNLLGVGIPDINEKEVGVVPGISSEDIQVPDEQNPEGLDQQQQNTEISPEQSPPEGADVQSQETEAQQQDSPKPLPEPDKDKIKKYGLEVEDHETNMDYEDKDYSIES
jgi:intein/homing endonuclease